MLRSIRNDLLYLLGILNAIEKTKKYSETYKSAEEFFEANEQLNYNACLNLLSFIGENTNKLSDKLKNRYKEIEWDKIINFRNRVVHDYQGLDVFIVYKIINESLAKLGNNICKIIEEGLHTGDFDKDEYVIAKENKYYRFIDFNKIKF
ncbi:MAG: DUF86 domain-containing protein [Candidatus Melainabacteria bacterium]|nr:DUF86 domain-containing protein [Candidatus Melainabacteria bacterium]